MPFRFSCARGIIIIAAWGSERPARHSSSNTWSNASESEVPGATSGRQRSRSSPNRSDSRIASRACIQLMFPASVLISPLWALIRCGWASAQLGKVFVEKREWTIASALCSVGSRRSA